MSLSTDQHLNLVTVKDGSFIANIANTSGLGDLGAVLLKIDDTVMPKALPCREFPTTFKGKLKNNLDPHFERNDLILIDEPTDF